MNQVLHTIYAGLGCPTVHGLKGFPAVTQSWFTHPWYFHTSLVILRVAAVQGSGCFQPYGVNFLLMEKR